MGFVKVPDDLPSPQAYLRAGLPRPTPSTVRSEVAVRESRPEEAAPLSVAGFNALDAPAGRSITTVAEDGTPVAITWTRSAQYLTRPARRRWLRAQAHGTSRSTTGVLEVQTGPRLAGEVLQRPEPPDVATARVVTFDQSVYLAGIDPSRFGPHDALFISTAQAIEVAFTIGHNRETGRTLHSFGQWDLSEPVPVDHYVLRMYAELCSDDKVRFGADAVLDRTDLLCAATAIIYDTPMYTAKPTAYSGLGNGLKVIEYGPTRSS
ncbi:MAG TPA: hypothetical protein VGK17_21390 [Propionicimonas sp.]|jgi:hypothetical protein